MAELKVALTDEFSLRSYWRCEQVDGSWKITYGPTTDSKTVSFVYTLPAGAIINKAIIHADWGSPLSGADIVSVNNVSLKNDDRIADITDSVVATATEVKVVFRSKEYGAVMSDANLHYGVVKFTNVYLLIDYTPPNSAWNIGNTTAEAGGQAKITVTPVDATFTHKLLVKFGAIDASYDIAAGVTSFAFDVPLEWLKQIPNAISGIATLSLQTISGSTVLGTSETRNLTITCPESVVPSAGSLKFTPISQAWGQYMQGYSSVKIDLVGYAGAYGSTIKSVTISGDGSSASEDTLTTGVLRNSGEISFGATVVDSRGRSSKVNASITVRAYSPPEIISTVQGRSDQNGNVSAQGTSILVAVKYTYAQVYNNSVSVMLKYRAYGATAWVDGYTGVLASGAFVCIGGGNISANQTYEVQITVQDAITAANAVRTIGTAYAYVYWDPENNAVGFGGRPSGNNRMQLSPEWELYLGAKTVFDHMHPVGSVCFLVNGVVLDEATYGEWKQIGTITIGSATVNAWQRTA